MKKVVICLEYSSLSFFIATYQSEVLATRRIIMLRFIISLAWQCGSIPELPKPVLAGGARKWDEMERRPSKSLRTLLPENSTTDVCLGKYSLTFHRTVLELY